MMLMVHREMDTRSLEVGGLAGLDTVGWIYDTEAAHEKDSLTLWGDDASVSKLDRASGHCTLLEARCRSKLDMIDCDL